MPANIGGDIALRRAVCDDCKLRIEKFETPCLTSWTPVRFKRNMGRRRTGKRKNSLRLQVRLRPNKQLIVPMKNLHEQILEWTPLHVPYEQHPALIAMSSFKAPGFLRNSPPSKAQMILRTVFGSTRNQSNQMTDILKLKLESTLILCFLAV